MHRKIRWIIEAIEVLLVISFGVVLLYLFGFIAIYGEIVGRESNKYILGGELILSLLIFTFGVIRIWHIKL